MVVVCDDKLDSCKTLSSDALLSGANGSGGANGIVYMKDYLLVGNFARGTLVKLPIKDGEMNGTAVNVEISDPNDELHGSDGLVKVNEDVIIAITAENCILIESDDDFASAEIKKVVSLAGIEASGASTGALKSDDEEEIELYVTFPSWASLLSGT